MKAIFETKKTLTVEYSEKRTIVIGWYQKFISAYYYMLLKNNSKINTLSYLTLNVDEFCRVVSQGRINTLQNITAFDEFAINSCIDLIHVLVLKFKQSFEFTNNVTVSRTQVCDARFSNYLNHMIDLTSSKELGVESDVMHSASTEILTLTCLNALHSYCMGSITSDLNYLGLILCEQYNAELDGSFDMAYYRELYNFKNLLEAYYNANITTLRYTEFAEHYLNLVTTVKASIVKQIYNLQNKLSISQTMSLGVMNRLRDWYKDFDFDTLLATITKLNCVTSPQNTLVFNNTLDTVDVTLLASFVKMSQILYADNQMRLSLLDCLGDFNRIYYIANQISINIIRWLDNINNDYVNDVSVKIVTAIHFIELTQQSFLTDDIKASILELISPIVRQTDSSNLVIKELTHMLQIASEQKINFSSDLEVYSLLQFIWLYYSATLTDSVVLHCIEALRGLVVDKHIDVNIVLHSLHLLSEMIEHFSLDTNTNFINNVIGITKGFNINESTRFITKLLKLSCLYKPNSDMSLIDIGGYFDFANNLLLSQSVPIKILTHIISINKDFDIDFVSDIELNPAILLDGTLKYIYGMELQLIKLLNVGINNPSIIDLTADAKSLSLLSPQYFTALYQTMQCNKISNVVINHNLELIHSAELVYRHYLQLYLEYCINSDNHLSLFQSLDNAVVFNNPAWLIRFNDIVSLNNEIGLDAICHIDFDLYVATLINGSCFNEDGLLNYHGFLLTDSVLLEDYILYA